MYNDSIPGKYNHHQSMPDNQAQSQNTKSIRIKLMHLIVQKNNQELQYHMIDYCVSVEALRLNFIPNEARQQNSHYVPNYNEIH